jgi:RNA polymerase sigma factor (sigma-70 family)
MPSSSLNSVIENLRRAALRDGVGLGDGELLGRFVERRDEAALAALVERHAAMVWGVCRRLLSHHDAEDAFQATFLVLVRKAATVMPREMLGNWLYGVAHQTALQARRTAARRGAREVQVMVMPDAEAMQQEGWAGVQPLLDEELSRLPDIYRAVFVLCDLEGRTRKEVALLLGCPEGTVAGRLARGRTMLTKRLTQRGVALSGGALAAVLAEQLASASAPSSGVVSTIKEASLLATGKAAVSGAISIKVAGLTEGVMKAILFSKLKSAIAVVLILGFMVTGATLLTYLTAAGQDGNKPTAEKPVKPETNDKPKALKDEEAIQGTWQVETMEAGGDKVFEGSVRSTKLKYRIVIKGNKMLTMPTEATTPDVLKKVPLPDGTFVLNEKTSPRQIDWTVDGKTELGIYALENGKLKLCFDPEGKNRPTAFKTKKRTDQYYCVLKKLEKGKEKKE